MNWRRGFFRLWSAATLVWWVIVFSLTRPDQDRFMPWSAPVQVKIGNEVLLFPHDVDRSVAIAAR
jgi:hypothetical protein